MFKWIRKIFSPKIVPCFPFVSEMKQKDPDLFARIGHLPACQGFRAWKDVYPEDFPELDEDR